MCGVAVAGLDGAIVRQRIDEDGRIVALELIHNDHPAGPDERDEPASLFVDDAGVAVVRLRGSARVAEGASLSRIVRRAGRLAVPSTRTGTAGSPGAGKGRFVPSAESTS
jgi:hypothetical protein